MASASSLFDFGWNTVSRECNSTALNKHCRGADVCMRGRQVSIARRSSKMRHVRGRKISSSSRPSKQRAPRIPQAALMLEPAKQRRPTATHACQTSSSRKQVKQRACAGGAVHIISSESCQRRTRIAWVQRGRKARGGKRKVEGPRRWACYITCSKVGACTLILAWRMLTSFNSQEFEVKSNKQTWQKCSFAQCQRSNEDGKCKEIHVL